MEEATLWLDDLPRRSINAWNVVKTQFLDLLLPPYKILKLKDEIYNFKYFYLEEL